MQGLRAQPHTLPARESLQIRKEENNDNNKRNEVKQLSCFQIKGKDLVILLIESAL